MFLCFHFSGQSYDERVDIFSFGIMICEVRTLKQTKKKLKNFSKMSTLLSIKRLLENSKNLYCVFRLLVEWVQIPTIFLGQMTLD